MNLLSVVQTLDFPLLFIRHREQLWDALLLSANQCLCWFGFPCLPLWSSFGQDLVWRSQGSGRSLAEGMSADTKLECLLGGHKLEGIILTPK